jgi:methyl-accepting chemotaxis protein
MSSLSSTLASASTEQAAAIQESVAALTEMTSMIHQTHENTKSALESSAKVSERSEAGRQIMGRMSASMQSIEEANQALQGIATIIQEIHQKTGVIRDIVFKTQLLSFNASIEAARAGAAGRGFSVVAEEVGNLAQMSGTSATEIEALLSKSQAQVGSALEMIHLRIKEGQVVSDEAVKTFHTIAGSVQGITQQVKSIKEASDQQNLGIDQTQKAMQQLSDAAISNSETAQRAAEASKSLESLVQTLNNTSQQLAAIVHGERETQNKGPKGPTPPFTTQAKGDKGPLTADDPTFTRAS